MKFNTLQEAKQAAFTGAVRGLDYQEWKRCAPDGCAWHAGAPGFHCAIGWLIPWEDQKDVPRRIQGLAVAAERHVLAQPLREWIESESNHSKYNLYRSNLYLFLHEMQKAHDNSYSPLFMKQSFQELASSHALQWPGDVLR